MSTLLLVGLGPIQDFIASARRCQDLWFGSRLLSELARAAAREMAKRTGSESLIFPASIGDDNDDASSRPAVANKILVCVPETQAARDVADVGREAMRKELLDLANDAFEPLSNSAHFDRHRADAQLDDLMEYNWVAVPCERDGYRAARDRAEKLLAARKNTRTWNAVGAWAGDGPKSSLDGLRESVLDESLFADVHARRMTAQSLRSRFHVKKAERLCGVGLLKRIGAEVDDLGGRHRPAFHSTSHVASTPVRASIASCRHAASARGSFRN